jgi:hypothetical protein
LKKLGSGLHISQEYHFLYSFNDFPQPLCLCLQEGSIDLKQYCQWCGPEPFFSWKWLGIGAQGGGGLGFTQDSLQPDEKIVAVGVLPKDFIASDTLARDLVQNTLGIDAGSARHGCQALHLFSNVTHKSMTHPTTNFLWS